MSDGLTPELQRNLLDDAQGGLLTLLLCLLRGEIALVFRRPRSSCLQTRQDNAATSS